MKKGFTLVELLIVIVLLGALMTYTVSSVSKIRENSLQNLYDNKVKYLEAGALEWAIANPNEVVTDNVKCKCLPVEVLTSNSYITPDVKYNGEILGGTCNKSFGCIVDSRDNSVMDSYNILIEYKDVNLGIEGSTPNYRFTTEFKGSSCTCNNGGE